MAKPCYPWYCTECGSAINDRTNHVCRSKLKMTDGILIQMRAHDGRKESSVRIDCNFTITEKRPAEYHLARLTQSYHAFQSSVGSIPHHRRRFAYAIRIYAKPQGEE